jgi:LPS-assembly lipoprotein
MSSSERRTVVLSLLALGACGFTPVYGPGGAAEGLRGSIAIDEPSDREGFVLVRALTERLGPATTPRYRLSASIRTRQERIAVTSEGVTNRYQLRGAVDYAVHDIATGNRLTAGRVETFTSYSATRTTVATRAAQNDAEERLMRVLADSIVAELLATAPDWT